MTNYLEEKKNERTPEQAVAVRSSDNTVQSPRNLLPSPIAACVSLWTATSSLSLRIAGALGSAAVGTARHGALSSIEITRGALEVILQKAGQDVAVASHSQGGHLSCPRIWVAAVGTLVGLPYIQI